MSAASHLTSSAPKPKPNPEVKFKRFSNREAELDWCALVTTLTGIDLLIVPAGADDRDALEFFFDRVSPEDLYFRFLSGMRKVDEQRITAMLRDDDDFSIDFIALDGDKNEILANAVLVADPQFDTAEFAVCTREDAKNKGISWAMLDHAAKYAEAMGISRIFSVQSASQSDALKLERDMGFEVHAAPDDATLMLVEKTF